MKLVFEWDPRKDLTNREKHRIGFSEAASVFGDPLARIFDDPDHSVEEHREIIIGYSRSSRLVMVCFTELNQGRVRIISARCATRKEQREYEDNVSS